MKRSELKSYIKEQILSTLSEAEEGVIATDDERKASELAKQGRNVELVGEVEDEEADKEATKGARKNASKSKRLDAKINALKRIEADMQTELNAFKKAEGDKLKDAALKQLKRLTVLKKETEQEIKRLENEMV